MKIYYKFTNAVNGGFGVLGKGIAKALVNAGHELTSKDPDILFCYGLPNLLEEVRREYPNKPLVYYTVWESSIYPYEWADTIKKSKVDLLLTATEFNKWVLSRHGLSSQVWWHGIDERFQYRERKDDGVFTFLHYNAFEWRKGWEIVLQAFVEEFDPKEPVQLIMKARERDLGQWIMPIVDNKLDLPNVKEVLGHVPDEEMTNILATADMGVFPVKGEGWFMPATECVFQGIPVIMSKQMGMAEQFGTGYFDLAIDGYICAQPRYGGFMIQPSVRHLRELMRYGFEHQEELKELGRKGSEEAHSKFNWNKITLDFEKLLKDSNIEV